jgi:hypothetical protein
MANYPDGVYQVSYTGDAILTFAGIGQNNGSFSLGSDGYYHGSITVNHAWYDHASLVLHVTGLDTSNPFGNLSIITPGYSTPLTQEYTSTFLHDLQPFSDLRFVEWTQTINSTQTNWSDRVQPNYFTSAGPNGVSYEDCIELANEAHKNMWINIPALATTDYVQQMAQLIHTKLNPGLNVYVEYSNETWNFVYREFYQVLAAAQKNPLVTDQSNHLYAEAQETAYETAIFGNIFKQTFGADAGRVLQILPGWDGATDYNTIELQFLQQDYGNPNQTVYALAVAPYVDLMPGTDVPGLTMNGLFASVNESLDTTYSSDIDADLLTAKTYNVALVTYEAGQSFNPYNGINEQLKQEAQSDPRIYSFYDKMLDIWDQKVGGLMNLYSLNGPFWGLLPSITNSGSYKWDAVMKHIFPAGDANLDGNVTAADIALITANLGKTGTWWEDGDFIGDGVVDQQDLDQLNLILDAGFEQDVVGAGAYQYDPTGSAWTFSGTSGISGNNSGFTSGNPAAPQAAQVAFLQRAGSFSQTVSNWAAGSYYLTFDAAQRGNQASNQNFKVLVDGVVVGSFTPSGASYHSFSTAVFTVPAGSHTITFQGLNSAGGDNTAFIDAVARINTSPIIDGGFQQVSLGAGQFQYSGVIGPIGDPGFEQDVVGGGAFQYDPTGSAWAFSGSSGISGNNSGFTSGNQVAPDGSQVAFLQGTGSFSQTVNNWAAGSYYLTFDAAQRSNLASSQNFQVSVDGVVVGTFTPFSAVYQSLSTAVFTVPAGSHTIKFQALNSTGGDNTAFIDAVGYRPVGSDWTFSGGAGISANNSGLTSGNPPAPQGTQDGFLQGTGSFSQINLGWAAGTYVLTFEAAQRAKQASNQAFEVLVDDVVVGTFTPSSTSYQNFITAGFTITAGLHTVTFQGLDSSGSNYTAFIDEVAAVRASVSSITDGQFEQVSESAGQFQYQPSGSPWTFSANAGISANNSGFTSGNPVAPGSTQVAFLQGTGSFNQIVSNWAAGSYYVSFNAAQRGNQASRQNFEVLVDGVVVGTFNPSGTSYQSLSTNIFNATAGSHTITFKALNSAGGDNTALIDAVALVSLCPIGDPGFEQVVVGPGVFEYDPTGSAWAFSGSSGVSGNNSGFNSSNPAAPQGAQVAFLQRTGSLSQIVTGWAATSYVLTFDAAQRGSSNQASRQDFEVLVDGNVVGTCTPTSTSYQSYSTAAFTVTAGTHTITFQGLDSAGGDNTAFIDEISAMQVNPCPIGDAGFEQVAVGPGAYQYDPTGSAWAFSGSSGISGNNSGFTSGNPAAPQGGQVAFLQRTGSFSQIITGWPAGSYVLTFNAAQRGNLASRQNFEVLVDGVVVGTLTPTSASYQSYSTPVFTIAAGAHTITFQGLDSAGGDNTAFIDQISATQINPCAIGDAGFEKVVVGAGAFGYDPTGSAWAFSGSSGISGNNSGFTSSNPVAPQGAQVAFLQNTGSFSQSVTGWAAGSYVLTFDAAQRGGSNQASRQNFEVLVDGVVVGTFTPLGTNYQSYSTTAFTVTAGTHTITFQGLDSAGGDNTAFVDQIAASVTS